ncbi:MAG: hypothetical protein EBV06_06900 [Planctomycetia bacterium]|nr:hypothetical protein [Planctomycetia bacterium]
MPESSLVDVLLIQRRAWAQGERPTIEELLSTHTHLLDNTDAILDLIYNEVILREASGETPGLDDYLVRFPHLAVELRNQFELDGVLNDLRPPNPLPRLDGCDLLDKLGRGAMGTVYRGWQRVERRPVAVKILAGDVPAGRVRNEVQAVSRLQHRHIVGVYSVEEKDGQTALIMEYVEGGNLSQKLAGKPVAAEVAAHLVEQLARAIAYAHSRGVVHRDLKPSNILLSGGPDAPLSRCEPKIGDFGLAKLIEDSPRLTRTNDILGTPSYMAPEQASGANQSVGPSADVYALGAVLYECMTGRPPFVGAGCLDTLQQVREADPVPPSRLVTGTPTKLEIICLHCLHKAPQRRYKTAEALADDLHRFSVAEPILAHPVGWCERMVKWSRHHPRAALLAVVIMLVGVATVLAALVVGQMLRRERDRAVAQAGQLQERLVQTSSLLYTGQLLRVAALRESDPTRALAMLDDPNYFPERLRCFSWEVLHGLCKPYRNVQKSDGQPVRCFAASHDARSIALLYEDGEWDHYVCDSGRSANAVLSPTSPRSNMRLRFPGAMTIAVSADGTHVAVSERKGTVQVWESASSQLVATVRTRELKPAGDESHLIVGGLAISSDHRTLAMNSGGILTLHDIRTERLRRNFKEQTNPLSPVALSQDGTMVACALVDETLQCWDTRTGRLITSMKGMSAPIRAVAFHPTGRWVAAGAMDGTVKLWETTGGSEVDALEASVGPVVGLAFHPSRNVVAIAGQGITSEENSPDVQVWDLSIRRGGNPLRAHGGAIGVTFADDGTTLVTAGINREIKRWDFPGEPTRLALRGHQGGPIAQGDKHIAWVARIEKPGGAVDEVVWFDRSRLAQRTMPTRGRRVLALAIPDDGRFALTGSGNSGEPGEALVWDPERGWPIQVLPGHSSAVVAVACSPDGSRVATGCMDGTIRLWTLEGSKLEWAHSLGVIPSALVIDGDTVAACNAKGFAAWDRHGNEIARKSLTVHSGCMALRGSHAVVGGSDCGLLTWINLDGRSIAEEFKNSELPASGQDEIQTPFRSIASVSISPDGRTLAVAGGGGLVRVWDVQTRQERLALPGHVGGGCFVGFVARGEVLLTASRRGEMRFWYAHSGGRDGE